MGLLVLAAALVACSSPPDVVEGPAEALGTKQQLALGRAAQQLLTTPSSTIPWQPFALPGKRYVAYEPVVVLARPSLRVHADSSVSILRRRFESPLPTPGRLAFSWKVDALPRAADLAAADASDSPVGVVLGFEGDRSRWTPKTHRLSEMTRLLTGEELPFATLMYVWGNKEVPGTVVVNPRTDRIRKLVLDSGTGELGRWRDHVRDVQADYRLAFGEEPGPLRVVALMTDTDNTGSALTAWYGALTLETAVPAR
ncbi:MAG: DUF3047 domain-containing protein [Hydrogenophaga sp.]|uniref:DUF3047 domain-containing protein n=1 Tax=Hydrogenophaga sp. TaxID=1904254 RepID=UPI002ABCD24E|nr:DUF3047 domain-containing protein [Hydrogenophaga sp.]MDZ4104191.1 DUF3047 domain-containing protein [Hydrogenophaga sp.]